VTFIVAIDGPAGSGKSSVSRAVAKRLRFGYLDTGAGYRAFARHGINNPDSSIPELVASFEYEISLDPDDQWLTLGGLDVTEIIREPETAMAVSGYARDLDVRELQLKDALARITNNKLPGIVVEGRDITTRVAPHAAVRLLLTASEEVRLQRRGLEQSESAQNLLNRDRSDSKVVDFMTPQDGVTLIDTTDLDFAGSVAAVLDVIEAVQHG
jgi:CMP/dCMP kinase